MQIKTVSEYKIEEASVASCRDQLRISYHNSLHSSISAQGNQFCRARNHFYRSHVQVWQERDNFCSEGWTSLNDAQYSEQSTFVMSDFFIQQVENAERQLNADLAHALTGLQGLAQACARCLTPINILFSLMSSHWSTSV